MYVWRIEKLKAEMADRPLTDREVLPYLIAWAVLMEVVIALTTFLPSSVNVWDGLDAARGLLLTVLGTLYVFWQNGGSRGEYFLQRYFAVGWVVGVRWIAVFLLAMLVFYVALEALGSGSEDSTEWYDFVLLTAAEAGFYWRFGHHVQDLAKRSAAVASPSNV
jgi:hypothetical protein